MQKINGLTSIKNILLIMKTTVEQIKELLEGLNDNNLLSYWNDYQSMINGQSQVYEFDEEFFEIYFEGRPMEAARATFFGTINSWGDQFIMFNGYGNLESSYSLENMIDIDERADYINDHTDRFANLLSEIEEEI